MGEKPFRIREPIWGPGEAAVTILMAVIALAVLIWAVGYIAAAMF